MSPKCHLPHTAAVLLSGTLLVSVACAADVTGYAVLTTDYVFRGVTYSDGHSALQAAADIALDSGVYLGVWASSVDISGGAGQQRDLQLNYYLGYSHDFQNAWSVGANVVSYTFPGTEGEFEYDFLEYSIVANYDDRAWFEYSYSPDVFHSGSDTHNIDLYAEWGLPEQLMLEPARVTTTCRHCPVAATLTGKRASRGLLAESTSTCAITIPVAPCRLSAPPNVRRHASP